MFKNFSYTKIVILTALIAIFSFGLVNPTEAASLYLTSSSNNVTVGSLVTVNLLVNTQGKNINNAEATLQFSNDLLDIISVKGALFSLWVESPSFSNGSGRISFNGGIPDPGYNGSSKILTIVAKAKKAGIASFLFGDAAVRENDGLGTDILTGQSPVSFSITDPADLEKPKSPDIKPVAPVKVPDLTNGAGQAVAINSVTYSDPGSWYAVKDGNINWKLPAQASSVQTLIDHNPYSTPSVKYDSPILTKNISNLDDGIWYFHLRYLLNNKWSETSHYKIQIDSTPPDNFSVLPEKSNNCVIGLKLSAVDAVSGVDYYNIVIDNQPAIKVLASDASNIIPWPQLTPGIHQIVASVFDKAGNKTELITEVNIDKLIAPTLSSLPDIIIAGEKITVSAESVYTNAQFKLIIKSESGESKTFDITSDNSGKLFFESEPLSVGGNYQLSIYAIGCNEVNNSLPVQADIAVQELVSDLELSDSNSQLDYSLLWNLLKVLVILILLFGWYKYLLIKVRLLLAKKRTRRLSVLTLLDKADKELTVLEKAKKKKSLTRNEEKALNSLKKIISDLDDVYNK
jgi:hypothetical protein